MIIEWPSSRVIPPETTKISVTVSGEGIAVPIVKTASRPAGSDNKTTLITFTVPSGPDRLFSVTAHTGTNNRAIAFGNALASLTPGETIGLTVTLNPNVPPSPEPGLIVKPESIGLQYGIQRIVQPDDKRWGHIVLTLGTMQGSKVVEDLSHLQEGQFVIRQFRLGGDIFVDNPPFNFENLGTSANRKLDIAFVLDTTGSMEEEIAGVRDSVRNFADRLREVGFDLRLAVVTFGDVVNDPTGSRDPDGIPRPVLDFTPEVDTFKNFVGSLSADGGGDGPEVSLDATQFAANSLTWRPDAHKVIIVITDATAHQRDDGTDFSSVTAEEVINNLKGKFTVYVVSSANPNKKRSHIIGQETKNSQRHSLYFHQLTRGRESTQPYDMKNLAAPLGGVWLDLPLSGVVDLTELGLTDLLINTYRFRYPLYLLAHHHFVTVYVRINTTDGQRWVEFILETQ